MRIRLRLFRISASAPLIHQVKHDELRVPILDSIHQHGLDKIKRIFVDFTDCLVKLRVLLSPHVESASRNSDALASGRHVPSDFLRTSRASLFLRFLRYAGALLFRAMSTPDSPRSSNSLSLTPCFFLLFTVIRFLFQLSFLCTKRLTIYACYNFERANLCYFYAEKYKFIALFFWKFIFFI